MRIEAVPFLDQAGSVTTLSGDGIVVEGVLRGGGRLVFGVPVEGVGRLVSSLLDGLGQASARLGNTEASARLGREIPVLPLTPQRLGLLSGAPPDHVRIGIGLGPAELVLELPLAALEKLVAEATLPATSAARPH
jgi:hypothetical protein